MSISYRSNWRLGAYAADRLQFMTTVEGLKTTAYFDGSSLAIGIGYDLLQHTNTEIQQDLAVTLSATQAALLNEARKAKAVRRQQIALDLGLSITTAVAQSSFSNAVAPVYENRLNTQLRGVVAGSLERIVLFSLQYAGRLQDYPTLPFAARVLSDLRGAIQANNRAEAWYSIRYLSAFARNPINKNGFAKRAYFESQFFGLFDNANISSVMEAAQVYRMLQFHRPVIIQHELMLGGQVANANRDYGLIGTGNEVQTLSASLLPAQAALLANLNGRYPDLSALHPENFISTNIYLDPGRAPGEAVDVFHPDHSTALISTQYSPFGTEVGFRDILIGEGGDDYLLGGQGDDVLIGGKGNDTYYWRTGDGNDRVVEEPDDDGIVRARVVINDGAQDIAVAGLFVPVSGQANIWMLPGTELKLTHNSPWTILTPDGGTIDLGANFESGDFGIRVVERFPVMPNAERTFLGDRRAIWSRLENAQWLAPQQTFDEFDNYLRDPDLVFPDQFDTFQGSPDNDEFIVGSGNDTVYGAGGDDVILGGDGRDDLFGGAGNDVIAGGGAVNDLAPFYRPHQDFLDGGDGDDRLFAGIFEPFDDDLVLGGDVAPGSLGASMSGGAGDDYLIGATFEDIAYGGAGDDFLVGGEGSDDLFGDEGDDALYAGNGDDTASGGAGNDSISGGEGDDSIHGDDQFDVLESPGDDVLDGGAGNDSMWGGGGGDTIFGGAGDDEISSGVWPAGVFDATSDTLYGGGGNDVISASSADDLIDGGDGDDFISGNGGSDLVFGGAGDDSIYVNPGEAAEFHGDSEVYGEDGNDRIDAGAGDDLLDGGNGNDFLVGGAGADMLSGGPGADVLSGDAGDDVLDGGYGDDLVFGSVGNDILDGGPGTDSYYFAVQSALDHGVDNSDPRPSTNTISDADGVSNIVFVESEAFLAASIQSASLVLSVTPGGFVLHYGTQGDFVVLDGAVVEAGEPRLQVSRAYLDSAGNPVITTQDIGAWSSLVAYQTGSFDGDVLVAAAGHANSIYGAGGGDLIFGEALADSLVGGPGDDYIDGGAGDDRYFYSLGDGNDYVLDADDTPANVDTLTLGAGIRPEAVIVTADGGDIRLTMLASGEGLTLGDWRVDPYARIERLAFADGTLWNEAEIDSRIRAIPAPEPIPEPAPEPLEDQVQDQVPAQPPAELDALVAQSAGGGDPAGAGNPAASPTAAAPENVFVASAASPAAPATSGPEPQVQDEEPVRYEYERSQPGDRNIRASSPLDGAPVGPADEGGPDPVLSLRQMLDAGDEFNAALRNRRADERAGAVEPSAGSAGPQRPAERAPGLSSWELTNALLQFHLSRDDPAALGAEQFSGFQIVPGAAAMSPQARQDLIGAPGFGADAQSMRLLSGLREGFVTLA